MHRIFSWLAALGLVLSLSACGVVATRASTLPTGFQPSGIAFWSGNVGMIAGFADCPHCKVIVATTADGGTAWAVRLSVAVGRDLIGSPYATSTAPGLGFVSYQTCLRKGGYPYSICTVHTLTSTDRGATWNRGGPGSLDFSFSHRSGFGLVSKSSDLPPFSLVRYTLDAHGRLIQTTPVKTPCGVDALGPVAALGSGRAVLFCLSQPGIGRQGKDVFETVDGGQIWTHVLSVPFSSSSAASGLSPFGYPVGLTMLPDGHGWLIEQRGWLFRTTDAGRTWRISLGEPDTIEAESVSFATPATGYALLMDVPKDGIDLRRTTDGGRAWHSVRHWPFPHA